MIMMQVVMFSKLIISILLLPSLFFLASSSSVESEATCVGIDFSTGNYVCTSNPVETRRAVGHSSPSYDDMDLGVVQRMSGSAAEQLKIGEVLTKMRKYFENEVLVRSEYAHVRDRW
ncbi:hypothetical protein ACHAWC_011692 [Mediolabrus comicus]